MSVLPSWKYLDPSKILDGIRKQKEREEEWEKQRFEINRRRNARKIKALMKKVVK